MLSDFTSDQHDYAQCEHCGAPLAGRFTPCTQCNARPVESLGARRPPPSPLNVPLGDAEPMLPARLMTPRIWRPSSRDLIEPYTVADESPDTVPVLQRLRQPVVIGVSMLAVASAVYLGFLRNDDSVDSTPSAVSGTVKTQHTKPPVVVAQRPAPVYAAQKPVKPAPVRSPPIPPPAPQSATRSAATAAPQPATRNAATAAPQPAARSAATATASAQAKRNPGGPANGAPEKLRVDASKQIRSARANLQQNNLSATKVRLAAAIAAQPDNPDAQRMRSALAEREQQRDALLSVARGCSYVGRWACVWLKAGDALLVDSSSKEAQGLVSLAMRETELASTWPATPTTEATSDERNLSINHH
jgi:hypothetical protein